MNNLRMRTKLSIGFGVILLLTMLIGIVGIREMTIIGKNADFTQYGLVPQTTLAVSMDENMRDAGLHIRAFAASGDQGRWDKVMTALAAMKEGLVQAEKLGRAQPDLKATPIFLKGIVEPLGQFERSCNAVRDARANLHKATEAARAQGPSTIDTLNKLIDNTNENIKAAVAQENLATVNNQYALFDKYNALFNAVENLRHELFVALAVDDLTLMNNLISKFNVPIQQVKSLQATSGNTSAAIALLDKTAFELASFETTAKTLFKAATELESTNTELTNSYISALKLVSALVSQTQARNASIAQNMVEESTASIRNITIFLGIALVVGLGMTILLTTTITSRLLRFVDAAQKLSAGQFDTRVQITATDEIGQTAAGINKAFDVVVDKMLWYEAMLDAIPMPISVTDMNRNWTFLNKSSETYLGKTRDALKGRQCKEWGSPICGNSGCSIDCLGRGMDSTSFNSANKDFTVQISYITDTLGNKVGHIELLNDVTELTEAQKKAESALSEGMHTAAQHLEGVMTEVESAMNQLSDRIGRAENGSVEQAARVSETATAMEEMNSTVIEVARNASSAAQVSGSARQKALDGAEVVRGVVTGIKDVQNNSLVLKNDMAVLGEHAQAISHIMSVISDIADQTNLLALNAAIEAARAGEAGRGFAVVADEVRKLAEKTMTSTTDVGNAIAAIQQSAEKSSRQVDIAVTSIEQATDLAERSGEALSEIVSMVDSVADQVRAIATASEQQSASSEEINRSIMQVSTIATDTATSMQEASQSVDALAKQATIMAELMDKMKRS